MTLEQFNAAVTSLFESVAAMTVATTADGQPWAADVYFAADGYDCVFFSSPGSRHSRNLSANPSCAATVHARAKSWREIKGLQMGGRAEPVAAVDASAHAFDVYVSKFPFARDLMANATGTATNALNVIAHVFRPERIRYIDNTLGFGTRVSLRLENGEAIGTPEPE